MKKIFTNLFLFSFLMIFYSLLVKADSTKIYKDEYVNPLSVLNSFLWKDKIGSQIGLTTKLNVYNRNLNSTVHPASIDPMKIKLAFSKLQYLDKDNQTTNFIFNSQNLDTLSKHISKGLLLANNSQDVIFQFVHKKKKLKEQTRGIVFAEDKSLNLIFFQIHDCNFVSEKKTKNFEKKKKEFHKNHPNFSFVKKNKNCITNERKILVTSAKGIYTKNTNEKFKWIIFTSPSWQVNTIN